ncbi:hypothetical protein EBS80_02430, partial [bacterium]|nr:hypothetical protein [bacterium]
MRIMRVTGITSTTKNGWTRVACAVESDRGACRTLWFEVPEAFSSWIDASMDPFLIVSLPAAMRAREDLVVDGSVDTTLLENLEGWQALYVGWFPDRFFPITVRAPQRTTRPAATDGIAVSAFSGGVDSFYTLFESLAGRVGNPVAACLYVHGFDYALWRTETYEITSRRYEERCESLGIRLIRVRTNAHEFLNAGGVPWDDGHGAALAACAHLLGARVSRFLIASSHADPDSYPRGSHPESDRRLSSSRTEIIHHGHPCTRVEKIDAVAARPECASLLRVCWARPNGIGNCGRCEKCLRTMVALDLLGARERFVTFPKPTGAWMRAWKPVSKSEMAYAEEIAALAKERG